MGEVMSAGEASVFPRIDPEHPLARAARETNDYAMQHGLDATLEWLEIGGSGELAYLAEQRALRAVAAASVGLAMGDSPIVDEMVAQAVVRTDLWRDMAPLLISCYLDGFAIGWKGHELAGLDHDRERVDTSGN
jgi:hypothetical protein